MEERLILQLFTRNRGNKVSPDLAKKMSYLTYRGDYSSLYYYY